MSRFIVTTMAMLWVIHWPLGNSISPDSIAAAEWPAPRPAAAHPGSDVE
jgi:hypothetical protein